MFKRAFSKIIVVITLVVFIILLSCCIAWSCIVRKFERKIFASTTEFAWLSEHEKQDATDETDLSHYQFSWSYGKIVEYEGVEYQVFAYEFSGKIYAKRYYAFWASKTDIDSLDDWDFALTASTNSDGWCYMMYNENRLYRVVGKDRDNLSRFITFFTSEFTVKLGW